MTQQFDHVVDVLVVGSGGGGMTAALGERISPAGFGDGPVSRPAIGNGLAVAFSRAGAAASFLTMSTT